METIPCPGCRTDLEPSATVCHICLRPRGKLEITRGFATLREMEKQRKKRPFIIAGRTLTAAVVGTLLYRFHAPLSSAASSAQAAVSKFANDALYPPPPPGSVAIAPPSQIQDSRPAQAPPGAVHSPASAPSAPSPAVAPSAAAKPARAAKVEDLPLPQFDSTSQWVFYGRVYDLLTLRPVENARLTFGGAASAYAAAIPAYATVVSDADGRFSVVLNRLPDGRSYEIHSTAPGHAAPALYESDIPYATLSLPDRREIARNAQDGDITLPPLTDVAGEASLRRDVFLAPSR